MFLTLDSRLTLAEMVHLADLRGTKGVTQRELAVLCGLSQSAIAHIEAGRTTPTPETALRIIRALEIRREDVGQIVELRLPTPLRKRKEQQV